MSVTTSPSALLAELRDRVHGRVIGPDDADYDQARTVTMGGIDRHPVAIVRVADTDDVTKVIATAREAGLELAVRCGGHSGAAHSVTEGGIVLDLHDMKGADFDQEAGTVVGPGWPDRRRADHRRRRAWHGRPLRRHGLGGHRRHHHRRAASAT